jgi:hypothetical protein
MTRRALWWVLGPLRVLLLTIFCLYFGLSLALSIYDARTKESLEKLVQSELRVGASKDEMTRFLSRHTSRYAEGTTYRHTYGGFVPQTECDRRLGREVRIRFHLNADSTLREMEVEVFYTGL